MIFTYTIDDIKQRLGYGARSNLFMIQLKFPSLLALDVDTETEFTILCEKGQLPGTRAIEPISVPFMGDFFNIPGDKAAEPEITYSFRNTENMKLRNAFELWHDVIQEDLSGKRTSPLVHKSPSFFVMQLDKSKIVVKKVELIGAYPANINVLDYDRTTAENSVTEITFNIDAHRNVAI